MKGFSRKDLSFSLCGLNCGLCPLRLGRHCPGCGGGAGNQSCVIARCSLQHGGIAYCFLCPAYPCPRYAGGAAYDSFITHQRQLEDIARAQEIGVEAYDREQARKVAVLQELLSGYDDGRRKTFYCTVVNLLPLQDVESVMKQIAADPRLADRPLVEKAEGVSSLFRDCALRRGIVPGLRRKPVGK